MKKTLVQKYRIINFNEGFEYKWYGNIGIYLGDDLFRLAIQFPFIYKVFSFVLK